MDQKLLKLFRKAERAESHKKARKVLKKLAKYEQQQTDTQAG
jgi:hypothetical protein